MTTLWQDRARRLEAARLANNAAADARRLTPGGRWDRRHPSFAAWEATVEAFWAAARATYPPDFWEDYQRLRRGDPAGVEPAIRFLKADPMCFRSGYIKADFLRWLGRTPLSRTQANRLRAVILQVTAARGGREFRRYCALARKLRTPTLITQLHALAGQSDRGVRRRAGWVLAAIDAESRAERAASKRQAAR